MELGPYGSVVTNSFFKPFCLPNYLRRMKRKLIPNYHHQTYFELYEFEPTFSPRYIRSHDRRVKPLVLTRETKKPSDTHVTLLIHVRKSNLYSGRRMA